MSEFLNQGLIKLILNNAARDFIGGWWLIILLSVTNIMSANISPRVQKEIIGFIGKNVGKHRQNKKYKNSKNYYIFEKIAKYRDKIGQISLYIRKNRQISQSNREKIAKKSGKISGRYIVDISPVS